MESLIFSTNDLHVDQRPFRFLDLPTELRFKVLSEVLLVHKVVDFEWRNYIRLAPLLKCFLVSKSFHEEASTVFYGGNTFRLFPTSNRSGGSKHEPLLARLSPKYRSAIVSLELRLGPDWGKPPKSWKVTDNLGLESATKVRMLEVFVELDPSDEIFNGFRVAKDFYTDFSGMLLSDVLLRLPMLQEVKFDGFPSVTIHSPLMKRLIADVQSSGRRITYGPEIQIKKTDAQRTIGLLQAIDSAFQS
ncbi:hypothetical protein MMC09_002513 [Bachmanniomyces sp. S44760]|nr:hypothetical protein [Bachmanniomyces sp. S44760]